MPSVDVYENFLKRSQAVAGGRRRSQAVGTPWGWQTTICDPKCSWLMINERWVPKLPPNSHICPF